MKLFTWSDDLVTGIKLIDDQHHELIGRVNLFLEKCASEGGEREGLLETFNFLKAYAVVHFNTENSLMHEFDYPDAAAHMKDHAAVRAWIEKTAKTVGTREITSDFTLEVNYFLVELLERHFRVVDRRMTTYLQELADKRVDQKLLRLVRGVLGQDQ